MITFADKAEWTTKDVHSTKLAGAGRDGAMPRNGRSGGINLYIAGNEQVKAAITIVVAPSGARRPSTQCDAGFFRHVGKSAVMIVMVQPVFSKVGNVDVGPAIVIVVRNGDAKSPSLIRNTRFVGYIGKSAVMIVVEQHGAWRLFLPAQRLESRAI